MFEGKHLFAYVCKIAPRIQPVSEHPSGVVIGPIWRVGLFFRVVTAEPWVPDPGSVFHLQKSEQFRSEI
jgi:hypothetical protein